MTANMHLDTDARAYLARARQRIAEGGPENLIYAALELRSGIEMRHLEYLDGWDHISKKAKAGWALVQLGKDVEREFKMGHRVMEISLYLEPDSEEPTHVLYHTPVPPKLRNRGRTS
jgi:hypothetical protein